MIKGTTLQYYGVSKIRTLRRAVEIREVLMDGGSLEWIDLCSREGCEGFPGAENNNVTWGLWTWPRWGPACLSPVQVRAKGDWSPWEVKNSLLHEVRRLFPELRATPAGDSTVQSWLLGLSVLLRNSRLSLVALRPWKSSHFWIILRELRGFLFLSFPSCFLLIFYPHC